MTKALVAALLLIGIGFGQDCKQPLDAETLDQLRLGWNDVQLRPGESYQFRLAVLSTYMPSKEVQACATWKVEPEGKGASIDPQGLLKIDAQTPAGSKFTVTADIEKGRAARQMPVYIYTEKSQPLVGMWEQKSQFDCDTGKEIPMTEPIRELEFRAKGWFSVTWTPFEVYRDYWGNYTADIRGGKLDLSIEHGNFVPPDFRGRGAFKLTGANTLETTGIYFGDKRTHDSEKDRKIGKHCRYVFVRKS